MRSSSNGKRYRILGESRNTEKVGNWKGYKGIDEDEREKEAGKISRSSSGEQKQRQEARNWE